MTNQQKTQAVGKPAIYSFNFLSTYFSAFLEWLRAQDRKHSLAWMARKLNLNSKTMVSMLAAGKRQFRACPKIT